jgi:hypothetical protein
MTSKSVSELMRTRRWCYWIPADGYVERHGFRVSIVFEYESGHYPTGDDAWIAGDASKRKPWFWGHSYEEAKKVAEATNQERLGLSPREAADIVTTSMSIKEKAP